MSETKWSPEPWRVEEDCGDGTCDVVCTAGVIQCYVVAQQVEAADAYRMRACVNACAGIPTEALEAGRLSDLLEALDRRGHEDAREDMTKGESDLALALARLKP